MPLPLQQGHASFTPYPERGASLRLLVAFPDIPGVGEACACPPDERLAKAAFELRPGIYLAIHEPKGAHVLEGPFDNDQLALDFAQHEVSFPWRLVEIKHAIEL